MNLQKIKNAKTKFLGKEIIYKEEIESTKELEKDLGKNNIRINAILAGPIKTLSAKSAITGEVIHVDNGFSTVGV